MASANSLKKLFKSYKQLDDDGFYVAAIEIINEEKQKNHNVLAQHLQQILDSETVNSKAVSSVHSYELQKMPKDPEKGTLLFDIRTPDRYLDEVILSDRLRSQLDDVIKEYHSSEILRTHGLKPRRKLLFAGPPGCGKTISAEVVASELGLPLLYTRFDAVISSYLGETAANLRKVFDFAQKGTWVVFFDEFDAIGKSRDDLTEHGELKRVVNTFLQLLDSFNSDSIFIAATNHESSLDNALWRRFDDILYFDKPPLQQIKKLIELKLKNFPHKNLSISKLSPLMVGWSHADIEHVCIEAIKQTVLNGQDYLDDVIFKKSVVNQSYRFKFIESKTKKVSKRDRKNA